MSEVFVISTLLFINAFLAFSEIALLSANINKLQRLANEGKKSAKTAVAIMRDSTKLISAIQMGITLVGIAAGAFGGSAIAKELTPFVASFQLIAGYSNEISFAVVISVITLSSLVIGELVPKRIAITNPDRFALFSAYPIYILMRATAPFVSFLSLIVSIILKIMLVDTGKSKEIDDTDITILMNEGQNSGVFRKEEVVLVERILKSGDRTVKAVMVPRVEMVGISLDDSNEEIQKIIVETPHSKYPVFGANIDDIVGFISAKDLLKEILKNKTALKESLKKLLNEPLFVNESTEVYRVLEMLKIDDKHLAVVVNEHGETQGLVTPTMLTQLAMGDYRDDEEYKAFKREDGTWLIDGGFDIVDLAELLGRPSEDFTDNESDFTTVAGFLLNLTQGVPVTGDKIIVDNLVFEVVDMDGARIDKILLSDANSYKNDL